MGYTSLCICATALLLFGCSQATTDNAKTDDTATPQITPAQISCQEPEFRQLDFWAGDWDLQWDNPDGTLGTGKNTITNSPYGDCVVTESFDGAPTLQFKGMSVSTYHKPDKLWRQTWVDDQGGYYALSAGPNADGTFALVNTRLRDNSPYLRMIWTDIKQDSLIWHWQGKKTADEQWSDRWVIRYTRKK